MDKNSDEIGENDPKVQATDTWIELARLFPRMPTGDPLIDQLRDSINDPRENKMHAFTVRTENRPAHPDRQAQSNKEERAFAHTAIDEFLASFDDQAGDCIGEITLTIVHQNTHLGIIYALEYEFTFEMEGAKHPVQVAGRHELRQIGNTKSVIDAMRYDLVAALEQAEEASLREHEVIKRWTEHWHEQQVAYRNRTSK